MKRKRLRTCPATASVIKMCGSRWLGGARAPKPGAVHIQKEMYLCPDRRMQYRTVKCIVYFNIQSQGGAVPGVGRWSCAACGTRAVHEEVLSLAGMALATVRKGMRVCATCCSVSRSSCDRLTRGNTCTCRLAAGSAAQDPALEALHQVVGSR